MAQVAAKKSCHVQSERPRHMPLCRLIKPFVSAQATPALSWEDIDFVEARLRNMPRLASKLSPEMLRLLATKCRVQRYWTGEVIMHPGVHNDRMLLLRRGEVDISPVGPAYGDGCSGRCVCPLSTMRSPGQANAGRTSFYRACKCIRRLWPCCSRAKRCSLHAGIAPAELIFPLLGPLPSQC